jgi:hypothetical protein
VAELLCLELAESTDGWPKARSGTFRLIDRALKPLVSALVTALAVVRPRHGSDDWLEFTVEPHADFRAPNHERGAAVEVAFSLKSDRFISSLAPSARIGFSDLAAHVFAIRAPGERGSVERRLLALLGIAYLRSLTELARKSAALSIDQAEAA